MTKVSVIIPNYNHARYLEKRIQSVLAQTFQDFELIYLDDASTDASGEVFAGFADDPRIRAIINETNSGSPFKQWNKGVREAKGEYVWIAEADDFADEGLLETLVAQLDQNPNVGLAYCQSWIVDEHDAIQFNCHDTTAHLDERHWAKDFVNDGQDECRRFLIRQNTIPNASAILFRRATYERAGYADETMKMCGDWMLWIKMLLLSDVTFVAEPLNYFRKHSGSVTHTAMRNGIYVRERYQIVSELSKEIPIAPKIREQVCEEIMNLWLAVPSTGRRGISWRRDQEIYKIARRVDPKLGRRLWRKIPAAVVHRYLRCPPLVLRLYWSLNVRIPRARKRLFSFLGARCPKERTL